MLKGFFIEKCLLIMQVKQIKHRSWWRYMNDLSLGNTMLENHLNYISHFLYLLILFLPNHPLHLTRSCLLNILLWRNEGRLCFCLDKRYSLHVPQSENSILFRCSTLYLKWNLFWEETLLFNTGPKGLLLQKALMFDLP